MPRYDPDIIAALAEGRLAPDEAARIEREIASDPVAAADLAAHRVALTALAGATPLMLTELERAGLRASIADAIGLAGASPVAVATSRRVPWGSLGVAAAALFGLIAIVPLVGLLDTGGSDDAATALAPEVARSTTALDLGDAAPEETTTGAFDAPLGALDFDPNQEAPGGATDGFGSSTTAVARVTTTTTATSVTGVTESDPAVGSSTLAEDFEALLGDLVIVISDSETVQELATVPVEETICRMADTELRDPAPDTIWTFPFTNEEQEVVVFFEIADDGTQGPFNVYDTRDCAVIAEITPDSP
jgi:hypothetical protein